MLMSGRGSWESVGEVGGGADVVLMAQAKGWRTGLIPSSSWTVSPIARGAW